MVNNPTIILHNILDIVNYPDDQQNFIDQFSESCMRKGLASLIKDLPADLRIRLADDLSSNLQIAEFEKIIYRYIAPDDYENAIQEATSTLFDDFLTSIESTRTQVQSDKLDLYLASF